MADRVTLKAASFKVISKAEPVEVPPEDEVPAAVPPDPVKALFDSAVGIFLAAGKSATEARSIAGLLRKYLGDARAAETIKSAHGKTDPSPYIMRILNDEITRRKRLSTEHAPL